MRLTLRTMLAYLDDVLEPSDAEVLGARISESEFASELVHRIRSSTRKMRLDAPAMDAQGVGVELNSVAEYLDNVLVEGDLADIERVCLESDMHLAEVASCHQILTLVLGEPAVVEDDLRRRVYQVNRPSKFTVAADSDRAADSTTVAVPPPLMMDKQADKDGVPDFLRAGRRLQGWHVAVIASFLIGLVLGVPWIGQQLGWRTDSSEATGPREPSAAATSDSPEVPGPTVPGDSLAGAVAARTTAEQADTNASAEKLADGGVVAGVGPVTSVAPVDSESPYLGKLVSQGQLICRSRDGQSWDLMGQDEELVLTDRWLVPPGFQARFSLGEGLQMTVSGYSVWHWDLDEAGQRRLVLLRGRFLLRSATSLKDPLLLSISGREGWLQLPEAQSEVALETGNYRVPGQDPREAARQSMVTIYQARGGTWTSGPADVLPEQTAGILVFRGLGQQPLEESQRDSMPPWASGNKQAESLDRNATRELVAGLVQDQPLLVQLQEYQANHRLHEVRALAARSLAVMGDYDTVLQTFQDKLYRASWEKHLGLLQHLIDQDVAAAEKLFKAVERQRGAGAERFYRLFWGYDPDQLEAGSAEQLVEWLSHESIDTRVVAFLNLKRITGKTQLFFPEKPTSQQATALRGWKRLLEEGAIRYAQEPSPWQDSVNR